MISKDTIKRTTACCWSDEDECFIVESPLFNRVIGTGETPDEARALFEHMLDDAYAELKAGNVIGYNKVGRPAKNGMQLNCKVEPHTHDSICRLAKALDISQGEVVDVLTFHYLKKSTTSKDIAEAVRKVFDERGITGPTTIGSRKKKVSAYRTPAAASTKKTTSKIRKAK